MLEFVYSPDPRVRPVFLEYSLTICKGLLSAALGTYVQSQPWCVCVCVAHRALGVPVGRLGESQVRPPRQLVGWLPGGVRGVVRGSRPCDALWEPWLLLSQARSEPQCSGRGGKEVGLRGSWEAGCSPTCSHFSPGEEPWGEEGS